MDTPTRSMDGEEKMIIWQPGDTYCHIYKLD